MLFKRLKGLLLPSRSFECGGRVLCLLCGFLLFASTAPAQCKINGQPFGMPLTPPNGFLNDVTVYSNCNTTYDPVIISAATNTNPVIFTAPNHGLGANGIQKLTIYGATGNWAPVNGTYTVTVIDANTFSIPVNAMGFGAVTGTPAGDYDSPLGTGLEWQCVEFVRRYYHQIYNVPTSNSNLGNASSWYANYSQLGLLQFRNAGCTYECSGVIATTPPQIGDILTSAGSGTTETSSGHVAIVGKVTSNQVCAVMQNWSENSSDADGSHCMTMTPSAPYTVSAFDSPSGGNSYPIQGWLRYASAAPSSYTITTVAGSPPYEGFSGDGGLATSAYLYDPRGVAKDAVGNLYIADTGNARIRKVSPSGVITTVAGGGSANPGDGGPATSALLSNIEGLALDGAGNIYFAEWQGNRIRKVSPSGIITTIAGNGNYGYSGDGGLATNAQLGTPFAVTVDTAGGIYIADYANNRVRKVSSNGVITTVAGNGIAGYSGDGGPATTAQLFGPTGVAVDASGNVYIADSVNNRIREVFQNGSITTVAGNGTYDYNGDGGLATSVGLDGPNGVALDAVGNLFIGDNNWVRVVSPSGVLTTVAGSASYGYSGDGGPATAAQLHLAWGIAIDAAGRVYVADSGNNAVRLLQPAASSPPTLTISKTHTGSFTQGQNGATYSVTVSNPAGAGATSGTVTVTETVPSGLSLVSMAGTGWSCSSNTCARTDVLNPGFSYPTIAVTVNVASNAASQVTNQVTVSGGDSVSATANDVTNITAVISKIATTTKVVANPSTIATTASTTLTATVSAASGSGAPSGTVTFDLGSTVLGSATLIGTGGSAQATLAVKASQLAVGSNSVTANYSGDINYNGSAATATVTVTLPQAGTTFLQLTSATSRDWFPVWRPDATKILFSSNRNNLTQANDVWDMNPDGSQQRELVHIDITTPSSWGDDGLSPYAKEFIGSTGDLMVIEQQDYWEVMRVALSAATSFPIVRTVWDGPDSFFSSLLFVPGGKGVHSVAYSAAAQNVAWLNGDIGTAQVRIAPFSQLSGQSSEAMGTILLTTSSDGAWGGLAFAPNGQQLIVSLCINSCSALNLGTDLYVLDATSGQIVQRVTTDGDTGISAIQPRWSPNGQWIAFVSNKSGHNEIWMIHPDGTAAQQVTANGLDNSGPSWSPDNNSLVFATNNNGSYSIWLASLHIASSSPPVISSVANAAGEGSAVAQNTWIEIKGQNLAPDTRTWQASDFVNNQLPTQLDGVSVTINGRSAYVSYISSTQVNVLTPLDSTQGSVLVLLTNNGSTSAAFTMQLQSYAPGLFQFSGSSYAAATHANGGLLGPTSLYPGSTTPATSGEVITLYCNGFGQTSPPLVSGSEMQTGILPAQPVVKIGGVSATVWWAGVVSPGLYQLNVMVPGSVPVGDAALVVSYNGVTSNTALLSVSPAG